MATQPDESKPTIVLVHGAWADASSTPRFALSSAKDSSPLGSPPFATSSATRLPRRVLWTLTGPIVLVGHSSGGNVISSAASSNDQVKALVYLNGWMCDEGESQQELLERFEGSRGGPRSAGPTPARTAARVRTSSSPPRRFARPSPLTPTRPRRTSWPLRSGRTPPPRSPVRRRARWRGRRCRAGTCSAPRTRRSRRRSSGSWPSARRDDRGGAGLSRLVRVAARRRDPAHPSGRRGDHARGESHLEVPHAR